jgi:hypothetical protein
MNQRNDRGIAHAPDAAMFQIEDGKPGEFGKEQKFVGFRRHDNGRRARIYELTAEGKKQLAAEEVRWDAVTSAVNRVLRMA